MPPPPLRDWAGPGQGRAGPRSSATNACSPSAGTARAGLTGLPDEDFIPPCPAVALYGCAFLHSAITE
eukprot:2620309-Lingulodinium_polyedra.AAC.1